MGTTTHAVKKLSTRHLTAAQRDQIIVDHIPLVKQALARISSRLPAHVDREDLLEAGMIGLVDAARRFEPARNVQFRTYAVSRVRGAIVDALRSEDWLPRSMRSEISRLDEARSELEQENSRPPTARELCARLDMREKKLNKLHRHSASCNFHSLDEVSEGLIDEDVNMLHSRHTTADHPDDRVILEEQKERLEVAITRLPRNERLVIAMYYFEQLNLREISQVLEVTDSRVCQIHRSALKRLRHLMAESEMNAFAAAIA